MDASVLQITVPAMLVEQYNVLLLENEELKKKKKLSQYDEKVVYEARIESLNREIDRLNNLVIMQNLAIAKLTEPAENGGYSGTSVPCEEPSYSNGTSTPITHCQMCGKRL